MYLLLPSPAQLPPTRIGEEYFAFTDSVDLLAPRRGERRVRLRFDAVPASEIEALAEDMPVVQALDQLHHVTIDTVAVDAAEVARRFDIDPPEMLSEWFRIRLEQEGLVGTLHTDPVGGEVDSVRIAKGLPPTVQQQRRLSRLTAMDEETFPPADPRRLETILASVGSASMVAVYDVGQGNLNAVCNANGVPVCYYDMGGGQSSDKATYPAGLKICHRMQPIILSHWDADHWSTADRDPDCLNHDWIAPRQLLGVGHRQLAGRLQAVGHLHVWPMGHPPISCPLGALGQATGRLKVRNDSGLVLRVDLDDRRSVLCPGDATYGKIPAPLRDRLVGLVASHHGGLITDAPPSPVAGQVARPYAVLSYGIDNTPEHPEKEEIKDLRKAGWKRIYRTPRGGVRFLAPSRTFAGCSRRLCTLETPQP